VGPIIFLAMEVLGKVLMGRVRPSKAVIATVTVEMVIVRVCKERIMLSAAWYVSTKLWDLLVLLLIGMNGRMLLLMLWIVVLLRDLIGPCTSIGMA
jgi:hypothetical protein